MPTLASPTFTACTGATTNQFFHSVKIKYYLEHITLPAEWQPSMGKFDLVTFTFGGNDVGFPGVIQQCVSKPALRLSCPSDSLLRGRIANFGQSYKSFLTKVANKAVAPGGNVLVLGYPELIEDPSLWSARSRVLGCGHMTPADARELRGLAGDLNATIGAEVAAINSEHPNRVHLTFVDVTSGGTAGIARDNPNLFEPSKGPRHEICSSEPWLTALSAIDRIGGSYHPKQAGQNAMGSLAGSVISHLDWSSLGSGSGSASVAVTNPGDQTGTIGTSVDLQIQASDTDSGSLTYSATGLPAGLSLDPTSGLITGVPTSTGQSRVSVSVTDSTGPQGSAAFIWTVTPVIVPASGPALVYTGYTADNPDVGDTSFTDFSGATGQDADVVDTLPDTLSGYRCAVLAVNTYFSDSDISTLQAFLNAGGTILALGEHSGGGFDEADSAINGLAASLGASGLSLNDDSYDDGDSQTTAIASSPLTAGVGALDDNWASSLTVNSPATTLVFTADDGTVPLVGVQQVNSGTFVLSGDSNLFSDNNDGFYEDADNGQFAADLCP